MERAWYALLSFLLIAGLAGALVLAWNNPGTRGRYAVKQAYSLLDQGRYIEATDLLERTLLTYNAPETRLALSFAYVARRDTDRAERQARLVLASGRADMYPAAWTQVGRVLQVAGRADEALDAWRKAIETAASYRGIPRIEADVRSAAWHTAMLQWARGNWDAARLSLQTLLEGGDIYTFSARIKLAQLLEPTDSAGAGQLLSGLPDLPSAGPTPTTYLPSAPPRSSPDLHAPGLEEGLSTGAIISLASGLKAARGEVARLAAKGASAGEIPLLWGSALLQQGEPKLAVGYIERAATLQPKDASTQAQLGLALLATGDTNAGIAHLRTAASLDPTLPLPHHALAQVYTQTGQWAAALKELDVLKVVEPASAPRQLELAEYYRLRGEYKQAEDAYIEAARLQQLDSLTTPIGPGDVDAQLALARFYIDVRGVGCERGLEPAQKSLTANPGNADALDAVGWALFLCGKQEEAAAALERAVAASPDNASYRFHLARTYAAQGRIAAAREQYTRVQDFDPGGPWSSRAITELSKLPNESLALKAGS